MSNYIQLKDLKVYQLGRKLASVAWEIYDVLDWQDKKVIGDQFIRSSDSYGANITEGYCRYHYLDKIKFYYIARASLAEADEYWIELMNERDKVVSDSYLKYKGVARECSIKLQNMITSTYKSKINYNKKN